MMITDLKLRVRRGERVVGSAFIPIAQGACGPAQWT
jgi:hypothetical protein